MSEIILNLNQIDPIKLLGENHSKLSLLRKHHEDVTITARGEMIKIKGEKKSAQRVKDYLEIMMRAVDDGHPMSIESVRELVGGVNPFSAHISQSNKANVIVHGRNGKPIKAKTRNQKKLLEASQSDDIVFAVGPAGTGKTYTAVAIAVRALRNRLVKKIILTRPAIEAGESLGFLPGDLKDKIDPYLRPLYDALDDMLPFDKLQQLMTTRIIEVAPLAYMRGRTLDNAYIILDEAQNCTTTQLKMFLTRMGPSAKCIITGDLSQVDLPYSQKSGLAHTLDILTPLDGISLIRLNTNDVVRHRLVKSIIKAYEKDTEKKDTEKKD